MSSHFPAFELLFCILTSLFLNSIFSRQPGVASLLTGLFRVPGRSGQARRCLSGRCHSAHISSSTQRATRRGWRTSRSFRLNQSCLRLPALPFLRRHIRNLRGPIRFFLPRRRIPGHPVKSRPEHIVREEIFSIDRNHHDLQLVG